MKCLFCGAENPDDGEIRLASLEGDSLLNNIFDRKTCESLVMRVGKEILTEREMEIVSAIVVEKKTATDVGMNLGLTKERVNHIMEKSARKLRSMIRKVPIYKMVTADLQDGQVIPIDQCGLSQRACNCLAAAGITNLDQCVSLSVSDLKKFKNFGLRSLTELKEVLAKFNMKLKDDNFLE